MRYLPPIVLSAILLCTTLASAAPGPNLPTPPAQPADGPGGSRYPHARVRASGPFGEGARAYYLYEPAQPAPASAPVIAFLHGYTAISPRLYLGWIEHLARRGSTVVFPVYQTSFLGAPEYPANAMAALKDAFQRLATQPGQVRPDAKGRWALVGHSMGCPISVTLAARAEKEGLHRPNAMMLVQPGEMNTLWKSVPSIMRPPAEIPDLLLLVVVGDEDGLVGEALGRRIFAEATGVRPANRNLIRVRSDRTGEPALVADHLSPLALPAGEKVPAAAAAPSGLPARMGIDALDHYGYWKWLDALTDAAFYGRHRGLALGNTPEQRFLGKWSNGTPVREPEVEVGR